MPIIDEQILDCAVFLYQTIEEAKASTPLGGSGFLVNIKNGAHNHIYAVTNKHVAVTGTAPVVRLNRIDGTAEYFDFGPENWTAHPKDDLAVVRLNLNNTVHRYATVPKGSFVHRPLIDHYGIGVGDDVFMVGRFIDERGRQTNRPMARFGNLMTAPSDPVMVRNTQGQEQESMLIELRSVVGFSGSPVFVRFFTNFGLEEKKGRPQTPARADYGEKTLLLGVFWGHFPLTLVAAGDHKVEVSAGVGCVVPAWRLWELLMTPKLEDQRTQVEDAEREQMRLSGSAVGAAASEPPASDAAKASEASADNPNHREDFTRLASAASRKKPQGD